MNESAIQVATNHSPIVPIGDMERMAKAIAASGLFGVKSTEQALALMLVAQAEGLHPATAARDYHVISGRPALKADAILARFMQAGGTVKWTCYTDAKVSAVFSHPQGGTVEVDWDMARAKSAGLGSKDTWKSYPRQMLRARVISEGVRTVYPGSCCGVYTPEEVQDFEPLPTPKNITPIQPEPSSTQAECSEESRPEEPKPTPPPPPRSDKDGVLLISQAQLKALFFYAGKLGHKGDAGQSWLREQAGRLYGVEHLRDLTEAQASEFITNLEADAKAQNGGGK